MHEVHQLHMATYCIFVTKLSLVKLGVGWCTLTIELVSLTLYWQHKCTVVSLCRKWRML